VFIIYDIPGTAQAATGSELVFLAALHVLPESVLAFLALLQTRLVGVLLRVDGLVFQKFDEFVETGSDDRAEGGTEPVDCQT
jgi:hypothetical protein